MYFMANMKSLGASSVKSISFKHRHVKTYTYSQSNTNILNLENH